jgi:hypothetical protein
LAEAGVPAVLAMQGTVEMETVAQLMPVLFAELQSDGQIDRAVAVARGAVRDQPDYWSPALYMRLRSGRIWYEAGFGRERGEFERWPALLMEIQQGRCTPILGHGLVEPITGSLGDIAQSWAQKHRYPLARHERESLPRVAQYLKVQQSQRFPYLGLADSVRQRVQSRYGAILPEELRGKQVQVGQLIEYLGARQRASDPHEPHKALARLNLPIYITAQVDSLLASALAEAGKDPQVVLCPWNRHVERIQSIFDREPDYLPTPERPLVYHLFGHLDQYRTLVLTEDDFFDYLIGVTKNNDLIPPCVRSALTDSTLLFLGFQVSDWSFRVLLRSILSGEGGDLLLDYDHIAAQIEPAEDRLTDPERALRYLEGYFREDKINVYWGSVRDFVQELMPRWEKATGGG